MNSQTSNLLQSNNRFVFNNSFCTDSGIFNSFSLLQKCNFSASNGSSSTKPENRLLNCDRIKVENRSKQDKVMEETATTCKHTYSFFSTFAQMPSSSLVEELIESRSQLRCPTHDFSTKMAGIIRDFVDVEENTSNKSIGKEADKYSELGNIFPSKESSANKDIYLEDINIKNLDSQFTISDDHMQSYADVTKCEIANPLPCKMKPINDYISFDPQVKSDNKNFKPIVEHFSSYSESKIRTRNISESSIDSEDSFIVFEYCEGDDISFVNDDCLTEESDNESVGEPRRFDSLAGDGPKDCDSDAECRLSQSLESINKKWPNKKVTFAEGKDLAEVHLMVMWDYAYRAARKGEWEMIARDNARFKSRVSSAEDILAPILNHAHREAVFNQRFVHSDSCSLDIK